MSEARLLAACAEGRTVGVKFEAPWCGDCQELNRELERVPLAALARLTFDVERDDVAPVVERLAILELPTLVVLEPAGSERGRVVGFADGSSWRRALDAVVDGAATLEALTERAKSGDRADGLALAEAQLSRDPAAGVAALEELALGNDDVSAEALHRLGRYHQRARRDPKTSRTVWRDLFLRFEDHPRALGALIWYARAQAALGHPEQGGDAFDVRHRARPHDAALVLAWAAFAAQEGLESQRSEVREAAMEVLSSARGDDRNHLENLVMSLGTPFAQKPAS